MRIVMIHNRYQQSGGEDNALRAETALLRARGHEVEVVEENNDAIVQWKTATKAAFECIYSFSSARSADKLIDRYRPDVAHIHNFFPRLSPSVHYAYRQRGVPVVQTLHNYRLLCPGATLFRMERFARTARKRLFRGRRSHTHVIAAAARQALLSPICSRSIGRWEHGRAQCPDLLLPLLLRGTSSLRGACPRRKFRSNQIS